MNTLSNPIILHIVISLATGGLERFVLDLIESSRRTYKQYVICLEQAGELAESCSAEVISLNMKPGLHPSVAWKIADIVRSNNINLIHTHNEKAQLYGGLAGLITNTNVIHTKHGKNNIDWQSVIRNNISARLCNKIIAVSRDAAIECIQQEKIPVNKVLTILNGIDTNRFRPYDVSRAIVRERFSIPEGIPLIGTVARLAPVKDHASLLKACRLLKEIGVSFFLLIVGDGSLRSELEELTDSLDLRKHVVFTGNQTDIPPLMQAMDLFILPSLSEGISLTLAEAMSCGLPVVATAVGGTPEVVVDGESGYLVPAQTPKILAEKIRLLLNDPELRKQFGDYGRQRTLEQFSLTRAADEYATLYRTLSDEKNK